MIAVLDDFDPLAEIAELARRQSAEKRAADLITAAKVRLVTGRAVPYDRNDKKARAHALGISAFFSSLVRRTKDVPSWDIPTADTNGKVCRYRPDWIADMVRVESVIGIISHERFHDAFGHHARIRHLQLRRANVAGDLSIDSILRCAGIEVPDQLLFPERPFEFPPGSGRIVGPFPEGLSLEQYYTLLPDDPEGADGMAGTDPGGWGQVVPSPQGCAATDAVAQQMARQALAAAYHEARQRGTLPGELERLVEELLAPTVNWQAVVQDWATRQVKREHSWARPSRKWLSQGHYLPSLSGEGIGHLVFLNDTSGSLDNAESRTRLRSEAVAAAMCAQPARVTIIHHDAVVQRVETWTEGDGELPWHPKGGGGTDHRPAFDELDRLEEPPDAVVALTDLCSVFPDQPPPCPVLWATTRDLPAPEWGKKVLMKEGR